MRQWPAPIVVYASPRVGAVASSSHEPNCLKEMTDVPLSNDGGIAVVTPDDPAVLIDVDVDDVVVELVTVDVDPVEAAGAGEGTGAGFVVFGAFGRPLPLPLPLPPPFP